MIRFPLLVFVLVLACCRPSPPPPEPPHVVTIGDASVDAGTICEAARDVLAALQCPEALADMQAFIDKCNAVGDDFDFGCVARARSTDDVHACHVRCEAP